MKNNIQMMISLLSMSAGENLSAETRELMDTVNMRFLAMSETQNLIYETEATEGISASALFGRLAQTIARTTGNRIEIDVKAEDTMLPPETAHCLAIIVNELLTNSIKHAFNGTRGEISITLQRLDKKLRLTVADKGRGYPAKEDLPRSSGLRLVRGLCRQIGATLELGNDNGAQSVVHLPDPAAS